MVSLEFSEGISETLDILNHMDRMYIDKIPRKFIEFLEKNKSANYISNLDHSKKLNEMNLKEKTKDILATIYMNYWCTPQQKAEYSELLKENERKYQERLREKYNPDNIFKKNTQPQNIIQDNVSKEDANSNVAMVEYKESIFRKIINKIKSIFK